MSVKASKADALALFVQNSLSDFLEAMKLKFPGKYDDVQSVEFEGTPRVIPWPVPTWLRGLGIGAAVVAALIILILGVKYRKVIVQKYKYKAMQYREERRARVMEDFNLPRDMYFDPQSTQNGGIVFETPYGMVCEAKMIPISVPKPKGTFVEA